MATAARSSGRTVRAAVATAISDARSAGRLKPWHEPAAAVALKVAAALGRPKLSIMDLTRLSSELDKMLSRLPLAEPAERGGSGDGSPAPPGGVGEGDPQPARLASVLGTGPEVGNTALPA